MCIRRATAFFNFFRCAALLYVYQVCSRCAACSLIHVYQVCSATVCVSGVQEVCRLQPETLLYVHQTDALLPFLFF
jgi:hypothetical protein